VAFSLWLSRASFGEKQREVVARFRDVGNAKVGDAVVIRGVEAGRIQGIELAPAGWVDVRMRLEKGVQLPTHPVVILSESSMFGEWQATIMSRSAAPADHSVQEALNEAAKAGPGMMPGARLPDIAQLTAVAGQIAGDVSRVAQRVQVAFDDRAAAELRQSIRNFADLSNQLSQTVREQSANMNDLSRRVKIAMASVDSTADALQRTAARVDSSTSRGEVRQIVDNIGSASADVRASSAQLRIASRSFVRMQAQLDSVLSHTDSVMAKIDRGQGSMGLMVNDPSLYQNSDALVTQMRELLSEIRAHPRRYLTVKLF
jgi:phospholipid/cholesterol/gamma-HCH transport system substrate-binding protein